MTTPASYCGAHDVKGRCSICACDEAQDRYLADRARRGHKPRCMKVDCDATCKARA